MRKSHRARGEPIDACHRQAPVLEHVLVEQLAQRVSSTSAIALFSRAFRPAVRFRNSDAAIDALQAIEQLRTLLSEEVLRALQRSGMTRAHLGERLGLSDDEVGRRYGHILNRLEEERSRVEGRRL